MAAPSQNVGGKCCDIKKRYNKLKAKQPRMLLDDGLSKKIAL